MIQTVKSTALSFLIPIILFFGTSEAKDTESPPWQTDIEAGYSLNSGNTETESLHISLTTQYMHKKDEFTLHGDVRLGKSDGKQNEERIHGTLTYDRITTKKISLFLLSDAEKDKFKKLAIRLGMGGGSKYTFIKNTKKNISLSGALLYELEKHTGKTSEDSARLSIRPKIKLTFFKASEFLTVFFYQPKVTYLKDYRVDSNTSLTVPMEKYLHIKLSFLYQYNNLPGAGVKHGDMALVTSFVLSF